ncbi:MAG: hypothetical protein EXR66_03180 [Dehalococcoidia bacterium]|nr:hypothetical protein [Dehalococcoidia bacterium]
MRRNEAAFLSDVDRLLAAFEAGELVRPSADTPNLVDLARGIAELAGVPGVHSTEVSRALAAEVGESEHIVLVLIDGLGAAHLEREEGAEFLRSHLRQTLQTPFPSTTAVALTSFATGEWPARHSVTGWWTYLPSIEASATILPYLRRSDDVPLTDLGVEAETAFPLPALWGACPRDVRCVQPKRIAGTVYSRYQTGGHPSVGYGSYREGFEAASDHVLQSAGPTYTYLYFSHFDAAEHEHGPDSVEAQTALLGMDAGLSRLANHLDGRARIVVTSDHGHAAVPDEQRHRLRSTDPIASHFRTMPSGDMRVPSFHLLPGHAEAFADEFRARYGEHFVLLTPAEVEAIELLGPGALADETRRRLGDFVAISLGIEVLGYVPPDGNRRALQQPSHHSGLTAAEMYIPLVVA